MLNEIFVAGDYTREHNKCHRRQLFQMLKCDNINCSIVRVWRTYTLDDVQF